MKLLYYSCLQFILMYCILMAIPTKTDEVISKRALENLADSLSNIYDDSPQTKASPHLDMKDTTSDCRLIISCLESKSKDMKSEFNRRMKRCGKLLRSYSKQSSNSKHNDESMKLDLYSPDDPSSVIFQNHIKKQKDLGMMSFEPGESSQQPEDFVENEERNDFIKVPGNSFFTDVEGSYRVNFMNIRTTPDPYPNKNLMITSGLYLKRNQTRHGGGAFKNMFNQLKDVLKGEVLQNASEYQSNNTTFPLKTQITMQLGAKSSNESARFESVVTARPWTDFFQNKLHNSISLLTRSTTKHNTINKPVLLRENDDINSRESLQDEKCKNVKNKGNSDGGRTFPATTTELKQIETSTLPIDVKELTQTSNISTIRQLMQNIIENKNSRMEVIRNRLLESRKKFESMISNRSRADTEIITEAPISLTNPLGLNASIDASSITLGKCSNFVKHTSGLNTNISENIHLFSNPVTYNNIPEVRNLSKDALMLTDIVDTNSTVSLSDRDHYTSRIPVFAYFNDNKTNKTKEATKEPVSHKYVPESLIVSPDVSQEVTHVFTSENHLIISSTPASVSANQSALISISVPPLIPKEHFERQNLTQDRNYYISDRPAISADKPSFPLSQKTKRYNSTSMKKLSSVANENENDKSTFVTEKIINTSTSSVPSVSKKLFFSSLSKRTSSSWESTYKNKLTTKSGTSVAETTSFSPKYMSVPTIQPSIQRTFYDKLIVNSATEKNQQKIESKAHINVDKDEKITVDVRKSHQYLEDVIPSNVNPISADLRNITRTKVDNVTPVTEVNQNFLSSSLSRTAAFDNFNKKLETFPGSTVMNWSTNPNSIRKKPTIEYNTLLDNESENSDVSKLHLIVKSSTVPGNQYSHSTPYGRSASVTPVVESSRPMLFQTANSLSLTPVSELSHTTSISGMTKPSLTKLIQNSSTVNHVKDETHKYSVTYNTTVADVTSIGIPASSFPEYRTSHIVRFLNRHRPPGIGMHTTQPFIYAKDRLSLSETQSGAKLTGTNSQHWHSVQHMNPNDNWKMTTDNEHLMLKNETQIDEISSFRNKDATFEHPRPSNDRQRPKNSAIGSNKATNQYTSKSIDEIFQQQPPEMSISEKFTTQMPANIQYQIDAPASTTPEVSDVISSGNASFTGIPSSALSDSDLNKPSARESESPLNTNWRNLTGELNIKSASIPYSADEKNSTNKECHNIFVIGENNVQLLKAILNSLDKKKSSATVFDLHNEAETEDVNKNYKFYHSNKREVENHQAPSINSSILQKSFDSVELEADVIDNDEELFRRFFHFIHPDIFENFINVYKQYQPKAKSTKLKSSSLKRSNSDEEYGITRRRKNGNFDNPIISTLQQLFRLRSSIPKALIRQNTPKPEELYLD